MEFRSPDEITEENPLTTGELRAMINTVFNLDTSAVAGDLNPAADGTTSAKDSVMAEEEMGGDTPAEVAGGEMPEGEAAPGGKMTLADLAAAAGMSEDELMARMKELQIADESSIDGILEAISADESLFNQLVDLLKNAGKEPAEDSEAGGIM